jgi:hypothetical protein
MFAREDADRASPEACRCLLCGRTYLYDYRKGHTKRKCNSCRSNGRVDRSSLKREMVEFLGGRCEVCGYDRCLRSLCFHHIDERAKRFGFAGGHNRSRRSLWHELDKCVLLCLNCHGEVHAQLIEIETLVARFRHRIPATSASAR